MLLLLASLVPLGLFLVHTLHTPLPKVAFALIYRLFLTPLGKHVVLRRAAAARETPHSRLQRLQRGRMTILALPALEDNYSYVLAVGNKAVVVDPVDPVAVTELLKAEGLQLHALAVTHGHWDHAAGVADLAAAAEARGDSLSVYAPGPVVGGVAGCIVVDATHAHEVIPGVRMRALLSSSHTSEHAAFLCAETLSEIPSKAAEDASAPQVLFTGDFLFTAGAGKFFDGTATAFCAAAAALQTLPGSVEIFPGHEYAAANLAFGLLAEPENHAMRSAQDAVRRKREVSPPAHPCIPTTLTRERETNVFLRAAVMHPPPPSIAAALHLPRGTSNEALVAALRRAKDDKLLPHRG